jgi:hypothetical protein
MVRRRNTDFGLQNDFNIMVNTHPRVTFTLRGIIETDILDWCHLMTYTINNLHKTGLWRQMNTMCKPIIHYLEVLTIHQLAKKRGQYIICFGLNNGSFYFGGLSISQKRLGSFSSSQMLESQL